MIPRGRAPRCSSGHARRGSTSCSPAARRRWPPTSGLAGGADRGVDWRGATLWFGDERCVPPDDERSNYGMAKEALLDQIAGPAPPCLSESTASWGRTRGGRLRGAAARAAGRPRWTWSCSDWAPTAIARRCSPGKPQSRRASELVVGVPEAGLEPFVPRVTFTLPVDRQAERVVVLVTGEYKAEAVARRSAPSGPIRTCRLRCSPGNAKELLVLLDPPAAGRLELRSQVAA